MIPGDSTGVTREVGVGCCAKKRDLRCLLGEVAIRRIKRSSRGGGWWSAGLAESLGEVGDRTEEW